MTHVIIALSQVYFEATGEKRGVLRDCKVCVALPGYGTCVVSPSGIAHIAQGDTTLCGHDATGDAWWWPL